MVVAYLNFFFCKIYLIFTQTSAQPKGIQTAMPGTAMPSSNEIALGTRIREDTPLSDVDLGKGLFIYYVIADRGGLPIPLKCISVTIKRSTA